MAGSLAEVGFRAPNYPLRERPSSAQVGLLLAGMPLNGTRSFLRYHTWAQAQTWGVWAAMQAGRQPSPSLSGSRALCAQVLNLDRGFFFPAAANSSGPAPLAGARRSQPHGVGQPKQRSVSPSLVSLGATTRVFSGADLASHTRPLTPHPRGGVLSPTLVGSPGPNRNTPTPARLGLSGIRGWVLAGSTPLVTASTCTVPNQHQPSLPLSSSPTSRKPVQGGLFSQPSLDGSRQPLVRYKPGLLKYWRVLRRHLTHTLGIARPMRQHRLTEVVLRLQRLGAQAVLRF